MSDISAEVLHQLYRDYCLAKFNYEPDSYISVDERERHIDNDARSYYEDGGEEGADGHVGALAELVKAAYAAGRDSALAGDEWRIVAVKPRNGGEVINDRARSEWEAKALLKVARTFDSAARLEHRRTGSSEWERVDTDG